MKKILLTLMLLALTKGAVFAQNLEQVEKLSYQEFKAKVTSLAKSDAGFSTWALLNYDLPIVYREIIAGDYAFLKSTKARFKKPLKGSKNYDSEMYKYDTTKLVQSVKDFVELSEFIDRYSKVNINEVVKFLPDATSTERAILFVMLMVAGDHRHFYLLCKYGGPNPQATTSHLQDYSYKYSTPPTVGRWPEVNFYKREQSLRFLHSFGVIFRTCYIDLFTQNQEDYTDRLKDVYIDMLLLKFIRANHLETGLPNREKIANIRSEIMQLPTFQRTMALVYFRKRVYGFSYGGRNYPMAMVVGQNRFKAESQLFELINKEECHNLRNYRYKESEQDLLFSQIFKKRQASKLDLLITEDELLYLFSQLDKKDLEDYILGEFSNPEIWPIYKDGNLTINEDWSASDDDVWAEYIIDNYKLFWDKEEFEQLFSKSWLSSIFKLRATFKEHGLKIDYSDK